jgi:GntR family transcriptional regulator
VRVPTVALMPAIDPLGPVPLYQQLADALRARITSGDLPAGRALPSRERLADEYGVARGTVERALSVLREQGLVATTPGRGVFVVDQDEG